MSGTYVPPHRRNAAGGHNQDASRPSSSGQSRPSSSDQSRPSSSGQQSDNSAAGTSRSTTPAPALLSSIPMSRESSTDSQPWVVARSWRRGSPALSRPSVEPPSRPASRLSQQPAHASSMDDLSNRFSVLAGLENWRPSAGPAAQSPAVSASRPAALTPRPAMLASPPPSGPAQPPPSSGPARAQVSSKKLRLDELVPCRIVYVLNPTGEKSWRGHPGLVMAVAGRKAHVITLTTWKGKTCVQKWAGAEEPAKYRSWFVLVDNGMTENHDGLPVMMLQGDKKMPKLCYVDCKRTHWLDLSELEKFRSPGGDTEFFITPESNRALESHLAYLGTVETPWIDEVVVEEQWE